MLAVVHLIAFMLPLSFTVWGMSYALIIRRRGLTAPKYLITVHFLVVTAVLTGLAATSTPPNFGVLGLVAIVLSPISCSLLVNSSRQTSEKRESRSSTAYALGKRLTLLLSKKRSSWVLAAASAAICIGVYWVGYPWTYSQCLRWAARQPTNNGVAVALNQVCNEMQPRDR